MFLVIILLTFRILSVNCNLKMIDPIFPEFSNVDFNMTKMLSSASPYIAEEYCTPKKAWLLIRHGTKYPSEDILDAISQKLIPQIQELITAIYAEEGHNNFFKLKPYQKKIIQRIINWKNVTASGSHKDINEHGKLLIEHLGQRWNYKLNKLTKHLKLDEIEVLSSVEDRCVVSGKKFLRTFYEGDYDEIDVKRVSEDDLRLKLIKPAKKYVKVPDPWKPDELMLIEDLYFRNNSPPIIKRIQELLFPDHIDNYQEHRARVTGEIVQIMYSACAHSFYYEDEYGTKANAWCHLFTFEDFKILEEMEDLKYYHQNGYHIEHNVTMGNAITSDLLKFITESNDLKFKLFIGHTSNILSVITRFNLFRDEIKLTIDNIQDIKDRKWRTSFITPLGCNIMVVIYDCDLETLNVSFYLNEIPLKMVMNDGKTCIKCPIDDFIQKLNGFDLNYNLKRANSISESNSENKKIKEEKMKKKNLEKKQIKIQQLQDEDYMRKMNARFSDKNED